MEILRLLPSTNSSEDYCGSLKINIDDTDPKNYFICSKFEDYNRCNNLSIGTKRNYCRCENRMNRSVSMTQSGNGFVKDDSMFFVTDDLTVLPHSMDHTLFGLVNNLQMRNTSSVKEMTVYVTKEKVLIFAINFCSLNHCS